MRAAATRVWQWWNRAMFAEVPAVRLGLLRALVCAVAVYDVLLYSGLVFADAADVAAGQVRRPWTPLYYMQVLGLSPIGTETAGWLFHVTLAALVAGMLGVASRVSCAIGAVGFLWWTGLAYSFGKPHHDKVALAFALCALPFARIGEGAALDSMLRSWFARRRGETPLAAPTVPGTPLWLLQVSLAIGYCGAGSAKLLLGGPTWFNGYTLQGIMLGHDAAWSRLLGGSVFWCQVQSIGVVAVQTLFPLVFLLPATRWFFLPAATSFHLLTWQTMDTGPYMRVWLLLWAFVPIEHVPSTLRDWWRDRPWLGAAALLALLVYAMLVVRVGAEVVPWWGLLLAGAGASAWLVRGWRAAAHGSASRAET